MAPILEPALLPSSAETSDCARPSSSPDHVSLRSVSFLSDLNFKMEILRTCSALFLQLRWPPSREEPCSTHRRAVLILIILNCAVRTPEELQTLSGPLDLAIKSSSKYVAFPHLLESGEKDGDACMRCKPAACRPPTACLHPPTDRSVAASSLVFSADGRLLAVVMPEGLSVQETGALLLPGSSCPAVLMCCCC